MHQLQLPQKLLSKLSQNVKGIISQKYEDAYKFMTMERINQIRNQFYSVLLEMFTHYG
jgi:hypothetical protein